MRQFLPENVQVSKYSFAIKVDLQDQKLIAPFAAAEQAYSQWKALSAYLHPRPGGDDTYLHHLDKQAEEIEHVFNSAFSSWEAQSGSQTLRQHRRGLIDKAADVGILLQSQPSTYKFDWQASVGTRSNASSAILVISPALWKTVDAYGRPMEHPHTLVTKVVVEV